MLSASGSSGDSVSSFTLSSSEEDAEGNEGSEEEGAESGEPEKVARASSKKFQKSSRPEPAAGADVVYKTESPMDVYKQDREPVIRKNTLRKALSSSSAESEAEEEDEESDRDDTVKVYFFFSLPTWNIFLFYFFISDKEGLQ
jgi:hypothetical protein